MFQRVQYKLLQSDFSPLIGDSASSGESITSSNKEETVVPDEAIASVSSSQQYSRSSKRSSLSIQRKSHAC